MTICNITQLAWHGFSAGKIQVDFVKKLLSHNL